MRWTGNVTGNEFGRFAAPTFIALPEIDSRGLELTIWPTFVRLKDNGRRGEADDLGINSTLVDATAGVGHASEFVCTTTEGW